MQPIGQFPFHDQSPSNNIASQNKNSLSQADMARLLMNFQSTIVKQQMTIQFLLKQQQEQQQKLQYLGQFQQVINQTLTKDPQVKNHYQPEKVLNQEIFTNSSCESQLNKDKSHRKPGDDALLSIKEENQLSLPQMTESEPTTTTKISCQEMNKRCEPCRQLPFEVPVDNKIEEKPLWRPNKSFKTNIMEQFPEMIGIQTQETSQQVTDTTFNQNEKVTQCQPLKEITNQEMAINVPENNIQLDNNETFENSEHSKPLSDRKGNIFPPKTATNSEIEQKLEPPSPEFREVPVQIKLDKFCYWKPFKIIRRNGFKKRTEDIGDIAEEKKQGPLNENEIIQEVRRKKKIALEYSSSKAKYIWMNYGRKIIAFALSETINEGHEKIKQLVGKLQSKRDFKEVFGVKPTDSEEEKTFKIMFGKLALFFIYFKAEEAFEGSNYKLEMIAKKKVVISMIKKLIGIDNNV